MKTLEEYYGKFNEEKRLLSRHGQVEYLTSMKMIHEQLALFENPKLLDIGAGTGRYSVALAEEGVDVTAVELVKSNLGILKSKKSTVKAYQGNALDLSKFKENQFDVTLIFGPMYHLFTLEEKVKALLEAKRVTKVNGRILVAYCMNDYSILSFGFKENHIKECLDNHTITSDFRCNSTLENLYDYVTLEDIEKYNCCAGLKRVKIVAADGPANWMRPTLKAMDDETFELFMQYHFTTYERSDLMGASSHTLDILVKE